MYTFIDFVKKNWVLLSFLVVLAGAIFVRTYHFEEWLYFKMDQSRDALMMSNAIIGGPEYLPLLGPRVGAVKLEHGMLRLGPIYYYFQYIAGKIFDSTHPSVLAYPELFFSILALPLLFLFLRLYFTPRLSLFITTMYAFSFLIVEYSRFAWNPNSLQFFIILTFYGLLKFLDEQRASFRKWWLILFATGLAIGSQLHFFGFFSLLGISGLLILFHFRVWRRETIQQFFKKQSLKQFSFFLALGLGVFLLFYTPVIISDVMKDGQNTHNFFEALGSKAEKRPLLEKVKKDIKENLTYYCLLSTSECYTSDLWKNAIPITATVFVMASGFFLALLRLRTEKRSLSRNFLFLSVAWFLVFSILTLPVAFQLRPRFYIVVFAIPFIFLGFVYEFLEKRFGGRARIATIGITIIVLVSNIHGIYVWFNEQTQAQIHTIDTTRTLILKNKDGVTLGQLERVADWIYARHKTGSTLFYYVKPEHIRPLQFLFASKGEKDFIFAPMKITAEPKAQYFAVTPAKNGLAPVIKKFGEDFIVLDQSSFGQLSVYEITFPHRQIFDDYRFSRRGGSTDRIFFGDIFGFPEDKKMLEIQGGE